MTRHLLALILLGAATLLSFERQASAGNQDSYLLGNEAALSGGAVLAYGSDAGALWYNPAGLTGARRNALDVSASAFVLRARNYPGLVDTSGFGIDEFSDVSSVEYLSVPTSLVYVRKLSDSITFAGGLFVPSQDEIKLEDVVRLTGLLPQAGGGWNYEQRLGFTTDNVEYHGAIGFGFRASDNVKLGVALFGTYARSSSTGQFWTHFYEPASAGTNDATELYDFFEEERRIGMRIAVGMQWEITPQWHLGIAVNSPSILLYRWGDSSSLVTQSVAVVGQQASSQSLLESVDLGHGAAMYGPAKVSIGFTRKFSWGWIALEGDFLHGYENAELEVDVEPVGNVRLGARFNVSDTISGGVGLFTDLSNNPTPTDVLEERVHFFGISGGIEFSTTYPLANTPPEESLVFATTVGLRYAIGVGQVGALQFRLEDDVPLTAALRDAVFHDVSIHLGSAVHF